MFICYDTISAVARIALVKPEKARSVEDVILRATQMGQIVEKVASCITYYNIYDIFGSIIETFTYT